MSSSNNHLNLPSAPSSPSPSSSSPSQPQLPTQSDHQSLQITPIDNNPSSSSPDSPSLASSRPFQSNLSTQLADLRQSYHQAGADPPIQNIPPLKSSIDYHPTNSSTPYQNSPIISSLARHHQSPSLTPSRKPSTSNTHHNEIQHLLTRNSSFNTTPFAASSFKSASRLPTDGIGSFRGTTLNSVDDLTDDQKALIVRRHLMTKDEQEAARKQAQAGSSLARTDSLAESEGDQASSTSNFQDPSPAVGEEDYPSPFHLQGGDIHHAVYKWASKQNPNLAHNLSGAAPSSFNNLTLNRTRSVSISGTSLRASELGGIHATLDSADGPEPGPGLIYKDIMQPGGFRRAFLHQKRAAIGKPYESPNQRRPFTKSFIDFLSLYGHFGGEDLEEIDESEEAAFKALQRNDTLEDGEYEEDEELDDDEQGGQGETSPLLSRGARGTTAGLRQSSGRRVRKLRKSTAKRYPGFKDGSNGDANVTQAVLMLLKSLVGTGVLFLAKAFANGGLLFSIGMLTFISFVSLYSFLLLVETRLQIPGGFGEIGGILYGQWCRRTILFSLVISQIGFVAAYTIFIAQNLQAFTMAVTDCKAYVPVYVFIFGQLLVYLPLAMIRNIQKLSGTALVADVFILIGLLYVFGYELTSIFTKGAGAIVMFNSESFPLLIGTAVFAFEGIGLVIPITESMAEPQKFPAVLSGVMVFLTFLFAGAGACGYAAFGDKVESVVLLNLPQDNKFVNAVQFLYSMAIMLSTPLQLFPAVRIMENGLFSASGKYSNRVKWEKNLFRTLTVFFCGGVAWVGARDLDKFVSLIGSLACVPLCFCYPPMLHYRAIAKSTRQKVIDVCMFLFGCLAASYTTYQTMFLLINSDDNQGPPKLGKCEIPP